MRQGKIHETVFEWCLNLVLVEGCKSLIWLREAKGLVKNSINVVSSMVIDKFEHSMDPYTSLHVLFPFNYFFWLQREQPSRGGMILNNVMLSKFLF